MRSVKRLRASAAEPAGRAKWARGLVAAALVTTPLGILAQTYNPNYDRNTPYGSPTGRPGEFVTDRAGNVINPSQSTTSTTTPSVSVESSGGFQPVDIGGSNANNGFFPDEFGTSQQQDATANPRLKRPAPPNEFERYVETTLGRQLRRFGTNLLLPSNRDYAVPATATVPPGYILNVGDVISISMSGSTEGSVRREIDTDGKIFLPRVGGIRLAGVRYGDLKQVISAAVGRQYRGYDVTVSIAELRGVRVYVTGFANNPGAYSVNSLSTMANAVLAAGGPSSGGSFRSVKLYRRGELVTDFDLYEFLRSGNKSSDAVLQNEDVLVIAPLGEQVAVTGSVNEEAIYELKPGESIGEVLRYAGGLNELAEKSRVVLFRPSELNDQGGRQVAAVDLATTRLQGGDIVQALSEGSLQRPIYRQSALVRVEGEVAKPGNYLVPAGSSLDEVVAMAGGPTPRAYLFGARLERVSVRRQQQEAFDQAIKQLELTLAAAPITADQALDQGERQVQQGGAQAVLQRLREAEPDGRIVMDIDPAATVLPTQLTVENNDRILVPARASTVGVFGAVYRPASFLFAEGRQKRVRDYLEQAGGPVRVADKGSIFVVRANGAIITRRRGAMNAYVLPGDVVFVPIKTQSTSILAKIREITTIVSQVGLTAAALAVIAQ